MSYTVFDEVVRKALTMPDEDQAVQFVAMQLELMTQFVKNDPVLIKQMAGMAVKVLYTENTRFRGNDHLLRIVQILAPVSTNLGAANMFDIIDEDGAYKSSFKFHSLWAEWKAKEGKQEELKRIWKLARERLKEDTRKIDAVFWDIARSAFPAVNSWLDGDEEEQTALVFGRPTAHKARRRSVALIKEAARPVDRPLLSKEVKKPVFMSKKNPIRTEFIDREDGYIGISPEEFRIAMLEDIADMDISNVNEERSTRNVVEKSVLMEESTTEKSKIFEMIPPKVTEESKCAKKLEMTLQTVAEESKSSESTIGGSDPVIQKSAPVRAAPLAGLTAKEPMPCAPKKLRTESPKVPPVPVKKIESAECDLPQNSFTSNAYSRAFSVFSDTVVLKAAHGDENEPAIPIKKSGSEEAAIVDTFLVGSEDGVASQSLFESFSVFVDEDKAQNREEPSVVKVEEKENICSREGGPGRVRFSVAGALPTLPEAEPTLVFDDGDEITVAGFHKRGTGIVTSTPAAHGFQGINPPEDLFFNVKAEEEDEKKAREAKAAEDLFSLPPAGATFRKRKSFAPAAIAASQKDKRGGGRKAAAESPASGLESVIRGLCLREEKSEDKPEVAAALEASAAQAEPLPVPAESSPAPAESSPAPAESSPAPPESSPAPVESSPAPAESSPAPAESSPAPAESSPAPVESSDTPSPSKDDLSRRASDLAISLTVNPWDRHVRDGIMSLSSIPINRHDLNEEQKEPRKGQLLNLSGEKYRVSHEIAKGGFAKVFFCTDESGRELALKFETPSCSWEVYILDQLRKRCRHEDVSKNIMQVTDAYIFKTSSMILSPYVPHGTLLSLSASVADPHFLLLTSLGLQMARILRSVHSVGIVHCDAKPDNWMILQRMSEGGGVSGALNESVLLLIDWGRAVDLTALSGRELVGRAGTEQFDCREMLDGRSWTFQPDFFAFVASVHVIAHNKYMDISVKRGKATPLINFKRRMTGADVWNQIFDECLNIPSCSSLPCWDSIISRLETIIRDHFDQSSWNHAVRKFNQGIAINTA